MAHAQTETGNPNPQKETQPMTVETLRTLRRIQARCRRPDERAAIDDAIWSWWMHTSPEEFFDPLLQGLAARRVGRTAS